MSANLSAILFDLDGTLTDSQAGIVSAYRQALGAFGLEVTPEMVRPWIGPPLAQGFAALGVPPEGLDQATASYRQYYGSTGMFENRLYEGIPTLLGALRGAGVPLALATSKLTTTAMAILGHFGIDGYFAVIAGSTLDGSRVGKTQIVAYALEELGIAAPAPQVAMVGDHEQDMYAAVAHGLRPIGVTWGYGREPELRAAGATHLVGTVGDLGALLVDVRAERNGRSRQHG